MSSSAASLVHVPPKGFHRIRHYGLRANGNRKAMVAKARALLAMTPREAPAQATPAAGTDAPRPLPCCCPRCGGRMIITMVFVHGWAPDPHAPPAERTFIVRDKRSLIIRLDTS